MKKIRLALVGVGKIARDQHIPALSNASAFQLVAAASPSSKVEGLPHFSDVQTLLDRVPDLDAVAICTPPQVRYDAARYALERGVSVMLEKPPGATLNEVSALIDLAEQRRAALFATWHSREAEGVESARKWLSTRSVRSVAVEWREDVRVWHPGQTWIWQPGGLGVFDPGMNALSIITRILTPHLVMRDAELAFPSNCEAPIAAKLNLTTPDGANVLMNFDFRHSGPEIWKMVFDTTDGQMILADGGRELYVNGDQLLAAKDYEYPRLYEQFAHLVRERRIDADCTPLRLVSDAFLCGRRVTVEPFVT